MRAELSRSTPNLIKQRIPASLFEHRYIYLLVLPGILWFIVFCYLPMIGIVIAFEDYKLAKGIFGSQWAGLKYFIQFVTNYSFPTVIRNTVCISLLKIIIGFPAPIILALMLNEVKRMFFRRTIQTVSYLPHFVSWVVVLGIWGRVLSTEGGIVKELLSSREIVDVPVNFMLTSGYMWPIAIVSEIWKTIGWNSIIYLAALSNINPELYESAKIDGAGRFKQLVYITIPSIFPTISILFILSMGGILTANFDQLYILGAAPVLDVTEVIDTYIFRLGLKEMHYSLGAAAGLMRSVLSFILVLLTNKVVKMLGQEGIW